MNDDGNTPKDSILRIWIIIPTNIVSTACSIFYLYHLLTKKFLQNSLNNHPIIIILINILFTQLIDVPFYVNYLYFGYVWSQTESFCVFWWNIDEITFQIMITIIAEASCERHILIFHEKLLATQKKRIFFHYIPLLISTIYSIAFFVLSQLFVTCDLSSSYDYTQPWCDYSPCFDNIDWLSDLSFFLNTFAFSILSIIFDIALIFRVVRHRRRLLHQPITWRKHLKMTIQLLSVSVFCSIFNVPMILCLLLIYCGVSPDINVKTLLDLYFISFFSMLFLPIVMTGSLPKEYWWGKWYAKLLNSRRRQRLIVPRTLIYTK